MTMNMRIAGLILLACAAAEARTWTSAKGSQVEAEMLGVQGDSVLLKAENGSQFRIRIADLSEADQTFVREAHPAPAVAAPQAPVPAAPPVLPVLTRPGAAKSDAVMYTPEQIQTMARRVDNLGKDGEERVEFVGGITFKKHLGKDEAPWKADASIPIKISCELARVKPKKVGGEDRKGLSGKVRFYLTDEAGNVLEDKTVSLSRMQPDTKGAGHEMEVEKPGKYTVVMVTEFEGTQMGLTETLSIYHPKVPGH